MPNPCTDPEILAAYQTGALSPASSEALERHAASCRPCREALLLLGTRHGPLPVAQAVVDRLKTLSPQPAIPLRARLSIAACLLLALGAGAWAWHRQPSAAPGPGDREAGKPALLPEGFRGSMATGDGAPEAWLARGAEVLLDQAADLSLEGPGRRIHAKAGRFWVEVSRGEAAVVAMPGATLTLQQGTLAVSLSQSRAAWSPLLREVQAAEEASGQVWVLEGQAQARLGDRLVALKTGDGLSLSSRGWDPVRASEADMASWWEARASVAASLPGRALFSTGIPLDGRTPSIAASGEAPPAYRWVTVLTGRDADTEVGLTLGVEGAWYQWPTGLASRPRRPREVLEVTWDGERLLGRVNGRLSLSASREELGKVLIPVGTDAWGVSVWSGKAVVSRSVLQEVLP